jgi:GNAT superfamily N-acetyltransferase
LLADPDRRRDHAPMPMSSEPGRKAGPIRIRPLTAATWPDLERLFGPNGACGGCWCMTPRLSASEYARHKGAGNKRLFRARAACAPPPGVLAYCGDEAVGWCAIAPREEFGRLQRSRMLAPVDDTPVWSIVCLYLPRAWRRRGLSAKLIDGAVALARRHGARAVEAYPIDPRGRDVPDVFAWTGLLPPFLRAGFTEVARRSATRPILRRALRRTPARRPR